MPDPEKPSAFPPHAQRNALRRIAVCDRLSLALRLKNRGCLVGEDSPFYNRVQCTWERGRSDDNDARALFLAPRLRNALNFSGSSRSFDLTPACFERDNHKKPDTAPATSRRPPPRKDHRGVDLISDALGFSVRPISLIQYPVHVLPFSQHFRRRGSRHCAKALGRL